MFLCMIKESAALPPSLLQVFNRGLSPIVPIILYFNDDSLLRFLDASL